MHVPCKRCGHPSIAHPWDVECGQASPMFNLQSSTAKPDELVDFYILISLTPCIFSCTFLLIPSQRCRHQWSDWEWCLMKFHLKGIKQQIIYRSIDGKSSGHRMNLRTCSILSFKRMSRLLSDFWFNRQMCLFLTWTSFVEVKWAKDIRSL